MKYEILYDQTNEVDGRTVYRIRALKDFHQERVGIDVLAGELGGWVESERNLSQSGTAWIYDSAVVMGNARVDEDAAILDNALVCGSAEVFGQAQVSEWALIQDSAKISGHACVSGHVNVADYGKVYGDAVVMDNVRIYDQARALGSCVVRDDARLTEHARISDNAVVSGAAKVTGRSRVRGKTQLSPINISGFPHNITITDVDMTLGCATFTIEQWKSFSHEQVEALEEGAGDLWDKYREVILTAARIGGRIDDS